jgi:hypothetical protein
VSVLLGLLAVAALVAGGGLAMAQLGEKRTVERTSVPPERPLEVVPEPLGSGLQATTTPAPPPGPVAEQPLVPPTEPLELPTRSRSRALGLPFRGGRLVNGVPFPAKGVHHFTYDPILHITPNRVWRRYATDRTVARTLVAISRYRTENPDAPAVGVGDLSRTRGGFFGAKFGGLGHASHQNGLDVDVIYPRKDKVLTSARRPRQVDQRLSQQLVDEFVRAGAVKVFVGPRLRLRGPRGVVMPLVHHDDHLHARFNP